MTPKDWYLKWTVGPAIDPESEIISGDDDDNINVRAMLGLVNTFFLSKTHSLSTLQQILANIYPLQDSAIPSMYAKVDQSLSSLGLGYYQP